MSMVLLALILLATLLVILSGVWVTLALIDAVWYGDRCVEGVPPSNPQPDARDTSKKAE